MHALSLRVTGFIASLILTIVAYFIILYPEFFNLNVKTAMTVIFSLALILTLVTALASQVPFSINVSNSEGFIIASNITARGIVSETESFLK